MTNPNSRTKQRCEFFAPLMRYFYRVFNKDRKEDERVSTQGESKPAEMLRVANRRKGIGRRGVLASALPLMAFARKTQAKARGQVEVMNVKPDLINGTKLQMYPGPQLLGYVIGIPQVCRGSRPGGLSRYGSPEWIQEITFIDTNDVAIANSARQKLGPIRVGNMVGTVGCGHVSKNVTVTRILQKGPSSFDEQQYPPETTAVFYSLAVGPDQDAKKPFIASEIWVSAAAWDEKSKEFIKARDRAANAGSKCSP